VSAAIRSARGRLLRRRGADRRQRELAELGDELGRDEVLSSPGPVARRELEVALAGPVGQDAEEVAQVGLGVELVEACGRDQREQVAGGLGVVVAADEEPGLPAMPSSA
jgi:hypothetical protein